MAQKSVVYSGPSFNNAAGRLFSLLDQASRLPNDLRTSVVWRIVLLDNKITSSQSATTDQDTHAIFEHLNFWFNAIGDIRRAIEEHTPHHGIYFTEFDNLTRLFTPRNLEATFEFQLITGGLLANLCHCAKDLPEDGTITPDEVKELREATRALIEQVKNSDLPSSLKRWLVEMLAKVEDAIIHFDRFGGKGLRTALTNLVGELIVDGEKAQSLDADPGVKTKLWALLGKLKGACETVEHVKTLYELGKNGLMLYTAYQSGTLLPPH